MAQAAEHGTGGKEIDPMHQFVVEPILDLHIAGFDASFTNAALFMLIASGLIALLTIVGMSGRAMVPGRWQSIVELSYEFVADMVRQNIGSEGQKFFPFIFTLFMFILFCNMLGMVPYSFTVTSQIIVTFAIALFVILMVVTIGVMRHGFTFLEMFVPKGVPAILLPLLVLIEVISYLTRPISLSVRLFANMLAGHTMLKVFAYFVVGMGVLGGWAPLVFMVGLSALEVLVAFLQAYVFAVLTCIYLGEAINMHH